MGTTKRSIKSQSLFLHSLEKTGGKSKKKKTETKKVEPKVNLKSKSKIKIPTPNYNFSRKSLFRDFHRTIEYRDLGKTLINKQKEPQQWLLKETDRTIGDSYFLFPGDNVSGSGKGDKTLFGRKPKATYVKSSKKRSTLSTTTNQKIPDYQGQIDHIAPIDRIREYIETHKILPTDDQLKKIFTSEQITQYLSAEENRAKGAKRLHEYTKDAGWGTEGDPQLYKPKRQAQSYADAMLEVAKILGTTDKGGMSVHEAQAYAEITGKAADPAHKALYGSKGTVPVFPPRNLTGFNAYKDHPDTAKPTKSTKPDRFMPHIGPEPPMDIQDDAFSVMPIQDIGKIPKIQPTSTEKEIPNSMIDASLDQGKTSAVKTKSIITAPPKTDKKVDTDDDATIAEVLGWLDEPIEKKEQTEETEAQRRGRLAGEAAARSVRKRADAAISEKNVAYQKPFKRKGVQLPFIRITG